MEAIQAIFQRKSTRHFTGEKISDNEIEILLKAGMSAPTAVNMQPCEFIVVKDKTNLQALADNLPHAKMLEKASVGIVVVAIPEKAH
ncbi:MAG: nitroreductase family protein [Candidatus Kapaibacteriales bacterium]